LDCGYFESLGCSKLPPGAERSLCVGLVGILSPLAMFGNVIGNDEELLDVVAGGSSFNFSVFDNFEVRKLSRRNCFFGGSIYRTRQYIN
jgi:hypothetical protein